MKIKLVTICLLLVNLINAQEEPEYTRYKLLEEFITTNIENPEFSMDEKGNITIDGINHFNILSTGGTITAQSTGSKQNIIFSSKMLPLEIKNNVEADEVVEAFLQFYKYVEDQDTENKKLLEDISSYKKGTLFKKREDDKKSTEEKKLEGGKKLEEEKKKQ